MSEPWPTLLLFIASLVSLYGLQRWISQHMQGIGMLLFNSEHAGMTLLWVVLLPGILLHELSHWAMAKILGLKTGRFRFWPQLQGKDVILGSVEVQQSNPVVDSLVGLAPFLAGTLALLFIGYWAFDAGDLALAWENQDWRRMGQVLVGTVEVADSWLWLYLMIAVSNAMMPSPSDRASWRLVLLYLALIGGVLFFLGWWPALPGGLVAQITFGLRTLLYAFALTLAIDVVFALGLALFELLLGLWRGSKVVYK